MLYFEFGCRYDESTPENGFKEGFHLLLKLKRVEIHGFKSFYDRTEMKFNGQGIAAVVGPNGCGKSNLSDAINWVLGEQSAKSLRGARMEDVIFAGTRNRKPLGMASVTMTLVADQSRLGHTIVVPAESAAAGENTSSAAEDQLSSAPEQATDATQDGAESAPDEQTLADTVPAEVVRPTRDLKADAERAGQKHGEITITRRLYRSGESEYLINGKLARLRDIQDLFLGTGLGPESYAIIEQGRIGQILSNRPQDRRAVIEEAAAITKFKTRKRLAEAKLEGAKQNLSRVFDILEEVNRQVNSLKRQAAKTKRYGELKAEMVTHLRQVLAARYQLLERETAKNVIELNLTSGELENILRELAHAEAQQRSMTESSRGIEEELTAARKHLADLQLEAERARAKHDGQLKQIAQIETRLAASGNETATLSAEENTIGRELMQHAEELASLEEQREEARQALEEKSAERQQCQSELAERERGLEAYRQQMLRLMNEASSLRNRLSQTEAQLNALDRENARAAGEEQQSLADLERINRVKNEISERLESRQIELTSVAEQRQEVEQSLAAKRIEVQNLRQSLDRIRQDFSRIKARKDSLDDIISHRSYTTDTVKRLFKANGKNGEAALQPVGVLADFIEVDNQWEKATEEFLHEELEYVVVRTWEDAEQGINLLRSGLDGRATFFVESAEEASSTAVNPAVPESEEGLVGRLTDSLRFTNGLSKEPLGGVPRITRCYLAGSREAAQRLASHYPDCWFLAPDGISYNGQSVSGGKKTGAGPLALKRELREVAQLERAKQQELTATEQRLRSAESEVASLTEHLEVLRHQQQAQEKDVLALDHESRKIAEEFQRTNTRLSNARLELDRVRREREKLVESVESLRSELERKEAARGEQETALESGREELAELQSEVARIIEEHSTLRAGLASSEERWKSIAAIRLRLENRQRELLARRENLALEQQRLSVEREQLAASNAELEQISEQVEMQITRAEHDVEGLASRVNGVRSELAAVDEALKALRERSAREQEKRGSLQVALARLESEMSHLDQTSRNELQLAPAELASGMEVIPGEEELAAIETQYQEVRRKIDALGPINPQALEEYEEAEQRQTFLAAQRQDLLDSIRDTEKAIQEIDVESRKRFVEAFHAINENFKEMFRTLFGGGVAEMRLTDEENVSESGIDIVASPPGKRLQSVLLLSGGEKALTAMALLMAVFQYTPSPFCILDEVDAPLDEPNTQRLTKLLEAMSQQTQFIVITHAKRTMEAAQALYGVTMQEPGVSKLVSVKFKPMEEVERNRAAQQAANSQREREEQQELALA